ncbi:MAG: hypothetical protein LBC44_03535 [Mycoplasmataceae bacterium]|nr:hypothetical protein [Mycoplasmataceae bacterium]
MFFNVSCSTATEEKKYETNLVQLISNGASHQTNTTELILETSGDSITFEKSDIDSLVISGTNKELEIDETINNQENLHTFTITTSSEEWDENDEVVMTVKKLNYTFDVTTVTTYLHRDTNYYIEAISLVANGNTNVADSTEITLVTNTSRLPNLPITNVSFENVSSDSEPVIENITKNNSSYVFTISGSENWQEGDMLQIIIPDTAAYSFSIPSLYATLHKDIREVLEISEWNYNGSAGTATTTYFSFRSSTIIPNFTLENIKLNISAITKTNFTHNGNVYTIYVGGEWTQGTNVQVSIINLGQTYRDIINGVHTFQFWVDTRVHVNIPNIRTDGTANISTTKVVWIVTSGVASNKLPNLRPEDIAIKNATKTSDAIEITKVTLQGTEYKVEIKDTSLFAKWSEGNTVQITSITHTNPIYIFSYNILTAVLHKDTRTTLLFSEWTIDGRANVETSQKFSFSTNKIVSLTLANIQLSIGTIEIQDIVWDSNTCNVFLGGTWENGDVLTVTIIGLDGTYAVNNNSANLTLCKDTRPRISMTGLSSNGSPGIGRTTTLTLTTNYSPLPTLAPSNVKVHSVGSSSNMAISNISIDGSSYILTLGVNSWTEGQTVTVDIPETDNYVFIYTPNLYTAVLHIDTRPIIDIVEWQVNGASATQNSTTINFRVVGTMTITAENIQFSSSHVSLFSITSSNNVYSLTIQGEWADEELVTLSIVGLNTQYNITNTSHDFYLYKDTRLSLILYSLTTNGIANHTETTQLTLTSDYSNLTISSFTLKNQRTDSTLTVSSLTNTSQGGLTVYTITLSQAGQAIWQEGDVVTLNIPNTNLCKFFFDGSYTPPALHKDNRHHVQMLSLLTDGSRDRENTTTATLTINTAESITFNSSNTHLFSVRSGQDDLALYISEFQTTIVSQQTQIVMALNFSHVPTWTEGSTLKIVIDDIFGYTFDGSPTAILHVDDGKHVTLQELTCDGSYNITTTTYLFLKTNRTISGLTKENISVFIENDVIYYPYSVEVTSLSHGTGEDHYTIGITGVWNQNSVIHLSIVNMSDYIFENNSVTTTLNLKRTWVNVSSNSIGDSNRISNKLFGISFILTHDVWVSLTAVERDSLHSASSYKITIDGYSSSKYFDVAITEVAGIVQLYVSAYVGNSNDYPAFSSQLIVSYAISSLLFDSNVYVTTVNILV